MKHLLTIVVMVSVLVICGVSKDSAAGDPRLRSSGTLDETLMGFKEQGIWYFLCTSPVFDRRIPPHYMTYGPPPPDYCPPPPPLGPRRSKICAGARGAAKPKTALPPVTGSRPPMLPRTPN